MTAELTPRQKQVLGAIRDHIREHGFPPTVRELGHALGITSTNGVVDALGILVRKGCLEWEPRKARGLRLVGAAATEPDYTGDAELYAAARAALAALRGGDSASAQALLSAVLEE